MLTDLECPACHHKITLSVSAPPVGQVRCPSCQTLITVAGTQIDGSTEPSPGQPSTLDKPGPRKTPLPRFPHVPAAGMTNAFASNH